MNQGSETEIKLAVPSLAAARRKIRGLGFHKISPRHFETNALYDFLDARLRKARCLLRVRKAGREWVLTFKGAPAATQDYKSREEVETIVKEGGKLQAILSRLGLQQVFRYDKYRTIFAPPSTAKARKQALMTLDETPIGNYLELEGSEAWIDRTAARLGYRREDYITASYAALYRQHCEKTREAPSDMVFNSRRV